MQITISNNKKNLHVTKNEKYYNENGMHSLCMRSEKFNKKYWNKNVNFVIIATSMCIRICYKHWQYTFEKLMK